MITYLYGFQTFLWVFSPPVSKEFTESKHIWIRLVASNISIIGFLELPSSFLRSFKLQFLHRRLHKELQHAVLHIEYVSINDKERIFRVTMFICTWRLHRGLQPKILKIKYMGSGYCSFLWILLDTDYSWNNLENELTGSRNPCLISLISTYIIFDNLDCSPSWSFLKRGYN